jgi:hypothetical protein
MFRFSGGPCRRRDRSRGRTGCPGPRCRQLLPRFVARVLIRVLLRWPGRAGQSRGPRPQRGGRARGGQRHQGDPHGSKRTSRRRVGFPPGRQKKGRHGRLRRRGEAFLLGTRSGQENSPIDRAGRRALLAVQRGRGNDRGDPEHGRVGKNATGRQPGRGPVKDRGWDRDPAPRQPARGQWAAAIHLPARRRDLTIVPVREAARVAGQEEGRAEERAVRLAGVQKRLRLQGRIDPGLLPQPGLRLARARRSDRKRAAADRPAVPARAVVQQAPDQDCSVAQDGGRAVIEIAIPAAVRSAARAMAGRVPAEVPDRRPAPARVTRRRGVRPLPRDRALRSRGAASRPQENQVEDQVGRLAGDRVSRPPVSAATSQSGKSQEHDR